jgi:hypothetical protein
VKKLFSFSWKYFGNKRQKQKFFTFIFSQKFHDLVSFLSNDLLPLPQMKRMIKFQYISDVHLEMMNKKIDYETIIKPIDLDKTGYLALAGGKRTLQPRP